MGGTECFLLTHNTSKVSRDKLVSLGMSIGKFTHSNKFRLTVGATDLLAQYAKYKVSGHAWSPAGHRLHTYR